MFNKHSKNDQCDCMKHLVVLSGACISKESGLFTFRDKDGICQNYNALELASIQG